MNNFSVRKPESIQVIEAPWRTKKKSMRKNELLFQLLLQYFFRYSRDASWSTPTLHISQRLKMFSALPSEPSRFVTPNKFVCAAEIHFE